MGCTQHASLYVPAEQNNLEIPCMLETVNKVGRSNYRHSGWQIHRGMQHSLREIKLIKLQNFQINFKKYCNNFYPRRKSRRWRNRRRRPDCSVFSSNLYNLKDTINIIKSARQSLTRFLYRSNVRLSIKPAWLGQQSPAQQGHCTSHHPRIVAALGRREVHGISSKFVGVPENELA